MKIFRTIMHIVSHALVYLGALPEVVDKAVLHVEPGDSGDAGDQGDAAQCQDERAVVLRESAKHGGQ